MSYIDTELQQGNGCTFDIKNVQKSPFLKLFQLITQPKLDIIIVDTYFNPILERAKIKHEIKFRIFSDIF